MVVAHTSRCGVSFCHPATDSEGVVRAHTPRVCADIICAWSDGLTALLSSSFQVMTAYILPDTEKQNGHLGKCGLGNASVQSCIQPGLCFYLPHSKGT